MADNRTVLFVDMLGFETLVEENEYLDELKPVYSEVDLYSPSPAPSMANEAFINFHRCLQTARKSVEEEGAGTVIVFSDSAFFELVNPARMFRLARDLMYSLVVSYVPARMGMATGTFRSVRFVNDIGGDVKFHMSQFMGTGVVRSCRAEQCGAAGCRVLLHPSLDDVFAFTGGQGTVAVEPVPKKLPLKWELNYLRRDDELVKGGLTGEKDDEILRECVMTMMLESRTEVRRHYVDTLRAMNRMSEQLGRRQVDVDRMTLGHL